MEKKSRKMEEKTKRAILSEPETHWRDLAERYGLTRQQVAGVRAAETRKRKKGVKKEDAPEKEKRQALLQQAEQTAWETAGLAAATLKLIQRAQRATD